MLKYICFTSSEEFEKWQQDHPTVRVASISPLVSSINLDINETGRNANGVTNITVFVVYYHKIDPDTGIPMDEYWNKKTNKG